MSCSWKQLETTFVATITWLNVLSNNIYIARGTHTGLDWGYDTQRVPRKHSLHYYTHTHTLTPHQSELLAWGWLGSWIHAVVAKLWPDHLDVAPWWSHCWSLLPSSFGESEPTTASDPCFGPTGVGSDVNRTSWPPGFMHCFAATRLTDWIIDEQMELPNKVAGVTASPL